MLFLWLVGLVSCVRANLLVNTKYGQVEGHAVTLGNGRQVRSFLGIPFAKSPTGDLRFAPPEEPDPWDDTFIADSIGNECPQGIGTVDEDCLNMNIFAPYNNPDPGPYPVLVYIHGGAYIGGSNAGFPGHFYADRGVILVSINYRLGQLGFLYTGDAAARGNYGLLDQQQALRFVQENIANFGGDPNRVSISGQSAGASSAGLLIVAPTAAGLFQQALLFSGTDMVPWAINEPWVSVNISRQIAEDLDCPTQPSQEMIDCLRLQTADDILDALFVAPVFTLGFSPTPDPEGGILPDTPYNLRERGQFNKVPLLTGRTSRELSTIVDLAVGDEGANSTEFRELIEVSTGAVWSDFDDRTMDGLNKALIFQYSPWPHIENREVNRDRLSQILGDVGFGVGMDYAAKYHAKNNLPTYMYEFAYRSGGNTNPEWMGVTHSGDNAYVQGRVLLEDNPGVVEDLDTTFGSYNQTDKDYSNYWMDLMANFVKVGNPTPAPHPAPGGKPPTTWRQFTMGEMTNLYVHNDTIEHELNLRQRTNALWKRYLPWVTNTTASQGALDLGRYAFALSLGMEEFVF